MSITKNNKKPALNKKPHQKAASASASRARKKKAPLGTTLDKHMASPAATGGAGYDFEIQVQSTFAIVMLSDGVPPCLPTCTIRSIKLQGQYKGYETDDMIVFTKHRATGQDAKLLAQIKKTINITPADPEFAKVVKDAWADYNNAELFNPLTDHFVLITSVIGPSDIKDTRTILEWARDSDDELDFLQKVASKNSSNGKRKKLGAFHQQLTHANGRQVSDKQLWEFMKSFHLLGYDLDIKSGATLSLVRSLVAQYPGDDIDGLRLKVIDEVRSANKNAGTVSLDKLGDEVRQAFSRRAEHMMPSSLAPAPPSLPAGTVSPGMPLKETVIAQLLGSWNEARPDDIAIVEEMAGTNYATFIAPLRASLQTPTPALKLLDGVWEVAERLATWDAYGPQVFDDQLDRLQNVASKVLLEPDPAFELDAEKRSAAQIYGKVMKYSGALRRGLAVSLTLLLNRKSVITSAKHNHAETVARSTVTAILRGGDWIRWASLKSFLSILAEAAPEQFLDSMDEALNADPCPFDELFAQETDGIFGNSYIAGVLWALEGLAWDERYLDRVAVQLAELAKRDPGGKFSNRPINSLTAIFLPWYVQTAASFDQQLAALKAIIQEDRDVAWKLLIQLLPNEQRISSGTHKPEWRPISMNAVEGITNVEYFRRVTEFTRIMVELAKEDTQKLAELVNHLDSLPQTVFEELLAYLSSEPILLLPAEQRQFIVDHLLNVAARHKRFSGTQWAMPVEVVQRVQDLAERLKAEEKPLQYRRLFSNQDFEMIDYSGDYNAQIQAFEDQRKSAMGEILAAGGLEVALQFARSVNSPWQAGIALGHVGTAKTDASILPAMLESDQDAHLVAGYVVGRFTDAGWLWVDGLSMGPWTPGQIGKFFGMLPFVPDTWDRVERGLASYESEYWRSVVVNPYQTKSGLERAIDKLAKFNRPFAALGCIYKLRHDKQLVESNMAADLLIAGAQSPERIGTGDHYQLVELIKSLQDDQSVDQGKLFTIEWIYMNLMTPQQQAFPKTLERSMASDAASFLQVLGLVFFPDGTPKRETTKQERQRATQAYRLLSQWRMVPGIRTDGTLDADALRSWLQSARQLATAAGLLDVALSKIGQVLSHSPPDPNGLWIHEAVAKALDAKDAKGIRDGFRLGIVNARGAHWVDPEGKPELALAEEFDRKARAVEDIGCARLGATLKSIADRYRWEHEAIRRENG